MISLPNMLMIGGSVRNVGKTTLSCRIIEHFSQSIDIVGIKIKTIRENDAFFHGKDTKLPPEKFLIVEEKDYNSVEDTSLFLKSGAKLSFKLKTSYEVLSESFESLLRQIPCNYAIICESNSLREFVVPGLYFLIRNSFDDEMKTSAKHFLSSANKIIFTTGFSHDFEIEKLSYHKQKNTWILKE